MRRTLVICWISCLESDDDKGKSFDEKGFLKEQENADLDKVDSMDMDNNGSSEKQQSGSDDEAELEKDIADLKAEQTKVETDLNNRFHAVPGPNGTAVPVPSPTPTAAGPNGTVVAVPVPSPIPTAAGPNGTVVPVPSPTSTVPTPCKYKLALSRGVSLFLSTTNSSF